jgi:hypothetical protein
MVKSYSLDGFDAGIYYFRFRAQDWSQNFAEDVAQLIVAAELDPPEIECTHSIVSGGNSSHLEVQFTVRGQSGIRTIVTSYTTDNVLWKNITVTVEEPFNNKVINGKSGLPASTVAYVMYAEDAYCVWGKTDKLVVTTTTLTSTAISTTTGSTPTTTGSTEQEPPPLRLLVGAGLAVSAVVVIAVFFALAMRRKP